MRLILFDVCWTLTSVNSTDAYISFLQSKGIRSWMKVFSSGFAHRIYWILNFIFKIDSHRLMNAMYFRWLDPQVLAQYHDQFWEKYSRSFIPEIFKQYSGYIKDKDSEVHLISGSFDMPIKLLAEKSGVTFSATRLGLANTTHYSWRIASDILWRKIEALWNHDLRSYSSIILYTDNLSDRNLIESLNSASSDFHVKIVVHENQKTWDHFFEVNSQINHEYVYVKI